MTSHTTAYSDLKAASAQQVRAAIRTGSYGGHTSGLAAGKLQCNLAILPERFGGENQPWPPAFMPPLD